MSRTKPALRPAQNAQIALVEPLSPLGSYTETTSTRESAEPFVRPEAPPVQVLTGMRIPPILLEGDGPVSLPAGGSAQPSELVPSATDGETKGGAATLPESYGTGRMMLAARDPHWLYAHWDLSSQQQRRYNALSADRHLVVRVHTTAPAAAPQRDIHVHPESRHWFIHVPRARTQYTAELGYYDPRRHWVSIAASQPAVTPADSASTSQAIRFATIPAHVRLTDLTPAAQQESPPSPPPLEPEQARVLTELATVPSQYSPIRNPLDLPASASWASQAESSASWGLPSSPLGAAEQPASGFWLSVNAELVVYGATEPGATVTLGGRAVAVRPDGTFSCRMSLPDGNHAVTVAAVSPQGQVREARLHFSRHTDYRGETFAAPVDPSLPSPSPEPGL